MLTLPEKLSSVPQPISRQLILYMRLLQGEHECVCCVYDPDMDSTTNY